MADYYDVLGIGRDATPNEIKSAFRKLAHEHHPDVAGDREDSEELFMRILEAYEVLGDPGKRRAYDLSSASGDRSGLHDFNIEDFTRLEELEDIVAGGLLETLFGRRGRGGPVKGRDIRFDIELELEDAFRGAARKVMAPRAEKCPDCAGTGAASGSTSKPCPVCNGLGQVKSLRARGTVKFIQIDPCERCQGRGKVIEGACPYCRGRGTGRKLSPVSVYIPAGVTDGAVLRLPDEGAEGFRGGPRGDLYLVVRVRPHPHFSRDGADLSCSREISFPLAALGGRVRIRTIDGNAELEIPAGTQSHTVFRLAGLGMPGYGESGRGDLLVTVIVRVPREPDGRTRELLGALDGAGEPAAAGKHRWWGH